tara:strand:- start:77 stop:364 length:288 start_codon:yes stop_codon:yes gene_type:complete
VVEVVDTHPPVLQTEDLVVPVVVEVMMALEEVRLPHQIRDILVVMVLTVHLMLAVAVVVLVVQALTELFLKEEVVVLVSKLLLLDQLLIQQVSVH